MCLYQPQTAVYHQNEFKLPVVSVFFFHIHVRLHFKTVLLQFRYLFVAGQAPVSSPLTLTSLVATYENNKRPAPVMGTFLMSRGCPHVRAFTVLLTENFAHMQPCPLYLLQVCWQLGWGGYSTNIWVWVGTAVKGCKFLNLVCERGFICL